MLAIALTLALFAFWTLLGYALVIPLQTRMTPVRNLLIAPTVGMVVNVIPLFLLSLCGLRVGVLAMPLAIVLLIAAAVSLRRFRPEFPWKQYLPFGSMLLLALLLVGRPMLSFNFDWVSFCNDDMANYTMGAHRYIDNGYFNYPDEDALLKGKDYTQYLWFLHVPGMSRPGSELLLAFVATVSRLLPTQVFMPVIMAMHLALIAAAAALVYESQELRVPAIVTAGLLAFSALASLGALYQLIAQVAGVGLICTCGVLMMRPFDGWSRQDLTKYSILIGIVVAGLAILYPEVLPFWALAYLVYLSVGLLRKRLPGRPLARAAIIAAAASIVILNRYAPTAVYYLLQQAHTGRASEDPRYTLFPYYLMPSGLANLWGFQPVATTFPEPWQSVGILFGGLLLIAAAIIAVRMTWNGSPVATYCLVMIVMALYLFRVRSGFGLFKLAMYMQPFLLGMIAIAWFALFRKPVLGIGRLGWQLTPLALLAAAGLYAQSSYVRSSKGVGATFVEIPDASRTRIIHEMHELVRNNASSKKYLIDSYNVVVAKFQGMATRGRQAAFPSNRFYYIGGYLGYPGFRGEEILRIAHELIGKQLSEFVQSDFNLHDGDAAAGRPDTINQFRLNELAAEIERSEDEIIVGSTPRQVAFNRRHHSGGGDHNFFAVKSHDIQNHLIFVSSELGSPYFAGGTKPTYSLFQLEHEPLFFKDRTMAGVGRHLLFRVINPSEKVRIVLDLTESYRADQINALPPASAIGNERKAFGMVGRGAARLVSEPITPQMVGGQPYVAIDMGEDGTRFPTIRTWLMKMYGNDVSTDRRKLVGFARDVSLVSDEQYAKFDPPNFVRNFGSKTNDLLDPDLEYSGIYEDGWISENAFAKLKPLNAPCVAAAKGTVPAIKDPNFQTQAQLLVDGRVVAERTLAPGDFDLRGNYEPPASGARNARVELRFSRAQQLSPDAKTPDNRPAAALLHFMGFEPRQTQLVGNSPEER